MPRALTMKTALAKAVALWGKRAAVQDTRRPSSPEKRAAASAALDAHRAAEPKIKPVQEWAPEITIGEYLVAFNEHRAAWKAWNVERDRLRGEALAGKRYSVGTSGRMFFTVLGSGDTWEEAFTDAEGKAPGGGL